MVHHHGGQANQVGVVVENLVKEVAAVVGGELSVPDQAVDILHADGLDGVLAVVDAVLLLEVDGVTGNLVPKQKDNFLLSQQIAHVQHLKMSAENLPTRRS